MALADITMGANEPMHQPDIVLVLYIYYHLHIIHVYGVHMHA